MIRAIPLLSLDALRAVLSRPRRGAGPRTEPDADDIRARRDMINDMLDRSPDAFGSHYDIEAVMIHYARPF